MDTKSKKYSKTLVAVMFLLCVVSFVTCLTGLVYVDGITDGSYDLIEGDFWMLFSDYQGPGSRELWAEHGPELTELRNTLAVLLGAIVLSGLIAVATLIYLIVAIGERDEEGKVITKGVDRIFTEVQLALFGFLVIGGGLLFGQLIYAAVWAKMGQDSYHYWNYNFFSGAPEQVLLTLGVAEGLLAAALGLWMLLSCVRKIKAGTFLKQSIIGVIVIALWRLISNVYHGGSLMTKVVLVTLGICVLSATIFLMPVMIIVVLVFAPKWVKKYEAIMAGVEEVKSGNLNYKIPVAEEADGELDRLAKGINEISAASSLAVQNELKNQRMKTELISNVSHDLKTPLTSMVTYIDLLKKEGLDSPNAAEYLNVLDQKTTRLRQLTEDLFEAAKASSGAIPVRKEKVDMLSLVNQGLGEMDQRIQDSGLEFILNAPQEKYYVMADGQLLWRVMENLLGNVLKYAQQNSRVYIDLKEQNCHRADGAAITVVTMEMKNMSRQALNIDPNELMERFKRGDESRTTEGSGLGLAIAKDLVRLMDGWFEIKIDGDLFKASVMLNKFAE